MSAARSGLYTALSNATVMGLSAVVGVVIAREFGRGAETDGFFAAYGLFVVLVLAAVAFRLVVLPALARAREDGRLAAETVAYGAALSVLALPVVAVCVAAPDWVAGLLTGGLPDDAQDTAADTLVWMVPAAVAQLYAGLAASALAALDDYGSAALGYAAGSVAGLVLILLRVDEDGIVAAAWGMALNGAVAFVVPAVVLLVRAGRVPGSVPRTWPRGTRPRLALFFRGVSLPLALQALYVIGLRFAAEEGVGSVTSFSYAYLIAGALVAVTASSLALVSSVPLVRLGLDPERAARHVVSTSWLALAVVAAAAGVFALAGEPLVEAALGEAYGGDVGSELGRLVVYLGPWMVASIGVSVTFPLLFVAERARLVPAVAGAALAVHVAVVWIGFEIAGLAGIAVALAATTTLVLAALLASLSSAALVRTARDLLVAAAATGIPAAAAFAVAALLLGPIPAALLGFGVFAVVLGVARPRGLREAWAYVHALR